MRSKVKLWFIYQIDDGNIRSQKHAAATKNPLIYENFGFIEFSEITMWKHDRA